MRTIVVSAWFRQCSAVQAGLYEAESFEKTLFRPMRIVAQPCYALLATGSKASYRHSLLYYRGLSN